MHTHTHTHTRMYAHMHACAYTHICRQCSEIKKYCQLLDKASKWYTVTHLWNQTPNGVEGTVHCFRLLYYREPDKLKTLVHVVKWQTKGNLTSWRHWFMLSNDRLKETWEAEDWFMLSNDRLRGTWQADDTGSRCQMTDWRKPEKLKTGSCCQMTD